MLCLHNSRHWLCFVCMIHAIRRHLRAILNQALSLGCRFSFLYFMRVLPVSTAGTSVPWSGRNMPKHMSENSRRAKERQPDLVHLHERLLQNLHSGVYTGGSRLPADVPSSALERARVLHEIAVQDTIQSVNGGVIVSVPAWDPEAEAGPLQVVRASPKMYGVERYDYVSFQRPDRPSRSYGHLRLLFKAVSKISPDGSHTTEAVSHEYAYMRMYEGAPANGDDKLARGASGCIRIKPDSRYNRAWYEVIPLNEILAREFVVAVPNEPGVFHVSSFMPN